MKQLTPLQTCFFALLTLLSSSICLDAAVTRRDSWIALLLLAALIPLLCWLYRCLAADGGPLETLRQACGVYLGTALALGYSVLGLALAAKNFRDFSQFVTFAGLAHSEDWLDGLMLALIVLAILTLNIEALGRLSRLTIPLAMLVFGVGIAILIREAEPARLLPLMYGTKGTLKEYFFTAATLIPAPLFFWLWRADPIRGKSGWGECWAWAAVWVPCCCPWTAPAASWCWGVGWWSGCAIPTMRP